VAFDSLEPRQGRPILGQPWLFAAWNASPNGVCKHNCDREYQNGDPKPGPSPDILLNRDSHWFTLTVPNTVERNESIPVAWFYGYSTMRRIGLLTRPLKKVAANRFFFRTVFIAPQLSQNSSEWMLPKDPALPSVYSL
jgi:hypothetical protein